MKVFKVFLPLFMIITLCAGFFSPVIATSESITNKILRLHIVANSDSTEDQDMKLKVRNYFLENTADLFIGKTLEENIEIGRSLGMDGLVFTGDIDKVKAAVGMP